MACPFFAPSRRFETSGWVRPPRFPLGDCFEGTCHASSTDVVEPTEDQQRSLCNCGYARGRCDRFPGGEAADAVRFSVTGDTPNQLSLVYVVEKDHAPIEYGKIEYSIDNAALEGPRISDILTQQARAFLESYLSTRVRSASV